MACKISNFEYTYIIDSFLWGSMPEWLMGADCKSAGYTYVGSNPTRPKCFFLLCSK